MLFRVTVVEAAPHILPSEDDDIAADMAKSLKKRGISVLAGCMTQGLLARDGKAVLRLADGQEQVAAKALLAVGRRPNTQGLGCESAGCRLDGRGAIETDEFLEAASHVYAIGDVNGRVQLAHAGGFALDPETAVGPSPFAASPRRPPCRALSIAEIDQLTGQFVDAAGVLQPVEVEILPEGGGAEVEHPPPVVPEQVECAGDVSGRRARQQYEITVEGADALCR